MKHLISNHLRALRKPQQHTNKYIEDACCLIMEELGYEETEAKKVSQQFIDSHKMNSQRQNQRKD